MGVMLPLGSDILRCIIRPSPALSTSQAVASNVKESVFSENSGKALIIDHGAVIFHDHSQHTIVEVVSSVAIMVKGKLESNVKLILSGGITPAGTFSHMDKTAMLLTGAFDR